jgi:hypothetical protein
MIVNVTCRTENCENKDIVIEFIDPSPTIICGPCNVEITDKVVVDGL